MADLRHIDPSRPREELIAELVAAGIGRVEAAFIVDIEQGRIEGDVEFREGDPPIRPA